MDYDEEEVAKPIEVIILAGGKKRLSVSKRARRSLWYWPARALHWLLLSFFRLTTGTGYDDESKVLPDESRGWDIQIGKERCIDRIAAACRRCPDIGRLILVADVAEEDIEFPVDVVVPAGYTIGTSLRSGASQLKKQQQLALVIFGDLPFVEPQSLVQFVSQCCKWRDDVFVSYVTRECSTKQYPTLRHTWGRFWDKTAGNFIHVCAGGIVMIHPEDIEQVAEKLDGFYQQRKNVLALAWQIGPLDLLLYVLGYYTIERLEHRISTIFDVDFKGICVPDAALAFNIDDYETYQLAKQYALCD